MNIVKIIQGDTYEAQLDITGVEDLVVFQNVYFSCKDFGICKELQFDYSFNCYVLKFSPEETARMRVGKSTFDITVKYIDSNVQTVLYCNDIIVLKKVNSCG